MKNNIIGRWRIIEMEQWDQKYIDEAVPGYIEFDKKKTGTFQFGYVEGSTDWRIEKVGGHERVAFSWEGYDEGDPVSGRGWATIHDTKINGRIYFHRGEESGFTAIRI